MRWIISLSAVAALCCGTMVSVAQAQHHHHGGSYWGSGNYYSPGHIDINLGHGYVSGHSGYYATPIVPFGGHHHHNYGGYNYGYGATWVSPVVTQPFVNTQPVFTQPSTVIVNANPAQPAAPSQLPTPKFGAYAQVPRVAADLADSANAMCLTMHKRFQNRPGFNATYRVAYSVLQQAQAIRDMSGNPAYREEITKRLPKIDEDMHRIYAEIGGWVNESSNSSADDIATLKRDVEQVGGALHYLMVDAGVAHKDQDPVVAARQASPAPPSNTIPEPPTPAEDRTVLKPVPPAEAVSPKTNTPPAEPKFGAYANVPKVSADVAALANRLCLTLHRGFQRRDDFDDAYAAAYSVLQQSQKIRDLARDPGNRQDIAKRLEKLDDEMHRIHGDVSEWINDPKATGTREVETLKRDFGTLGNAIHFLMTDVGVEHQDHGADDDPPAPLPKPKAKLSLPAPPSKGDDQ